MEITNTFKIIRKRYSEQILETIIQMHTNNAQTDGKEKIQKRRELQYGCYSKPYYTLCEIDCFVFTLILITYRWRIHGEKEKGTLYPV